MKPTYVHNGTYGCIMRPGVPCVKPEEAHNSNKVSKIFKDFSSRNEEIVMHNQIVEQIDPRGDFTVKLMEHCNIDKKYIEQQEIDKCKNFDRYDKARPKLPQIVYEYGGHDLTRASSKHSFEELFIAMQRAFKGVVIMEKKKFAHIDIKPDNIVYNADTGKLSLIDFGLASPFARIYTRQNEYMFEHTYPYFPPEFPAFVDDPDIVRNIKSAIKLFVTNGKRYMKDQELENMWTDVFGTDLQDHEDDLLKDVKKIDKYANRLDVYMLGVSLLEVLYLCLKNKTSEITSGNKAFYKAIINLISQMVQFLPSKRLTARDAYRQYKNVASLIHEVPKSPSPRVLRLPAKRPAVASVVKPTKECPPGKVHNPLTGRCIKIKEPKSKECPPGKERNPKTGRCVTIKDSKTKECPPGKERNPKTGRCVKICPPGKERNHETGKCQ
jgi:serine/threonine protein kinase